MDITPEIFLKLIQHCSLIHHIKGRLRVRVSHSIKDEIKNLGIDMDEFKDINFDDIVKKIDGIKSIKLNKLVGSITIQYDNNIFPKSMWDDALNGKNIEDIITTLNKTIKDVA